MVVPAVLPWHFVPYFLCVPVCSLFKGGFLIQSLILFSDCCVGGCVLEVICFALTGMSYQSKSVLVPIEPLSDDSEPQSPVIWPIRSAMDWSACSLSDQEETDSNTKSKDKNILVPPIQPNLGLQLQKDHGLGKMEWDQDEINDNSLFAADLDFLKTLDLSKWDSFSETATGEHCQVPAPAEDSGCQPSDKTTFKCLSSKVRERTTLERSLQENETNPLWVLSGKSK
jgi:hypothetical protein